MGMVVGAHGGSAASTLDATPTFPGGSGAIARHPPQPDQPQMPLSVTWPRHASGVA